MEVAIIAGLLHFNFSIEWVPGLSKIMPNWGYILEKSGDVDAKYRSPLMQLWMVVPGGGGGGIVNEH